MPKVRYFWGILANEQVTEDRGWGEDIRILDLRLQIWEAGKLVPAGTQYVNAHQYPYLAFPQDRK